MKPVSDALNNWIKTLITNHNHSRMKFIPMNDNKYDRGTSYVIEFGSVPHFQSKKDDTLIRICMSTYYMNHPNNNHIYTHIMITKPSVLRTDKPQDSSWVCISCDRLISCQQLCVTYILNSIRFWQMKLQLECLEHATFVCLILEILLKRPD